MATRNKIDSNETALAFAEETIGTPGTLPGTPVWYPLEPNSYDDFGGENTLMARRPINNSRQRKKGAVVDLDASGGFNQDLTDTNTQRLMQGFMYASHREKTTEAFTAVDDALGYAVADETGFAAGQLVFATGSSVESNNGLKTVASTAAGRVVVNEAMTDDASPDSDARLVVVGFVGATGDIDVDASGSLPAYTSTTLDFTTLGLVVGEFIYVGGDDAADRFTTAANNGIKRVHSIAANRLEIDKSDEEMVTEANTTSDVRLFFGRVLKNELADLIVRRSYNLERKLGAPDTSAPSAIQSEYLVGAFGSEFTMNIETADKINCDFAFVALDHETRDAAQNIKAGTRATIEEADAYNTSTDFSRLRMAIYSSTDEAPLPLFSHILDWSLSINNNVSLNKAVAVLGGFDVTLGVFEVMSEITAYFSTVQAVNAIRNNENITLDAFVVKNNAGFVVDLPLGALGDGRLAVEIDEPITLPLNMDAATAVSINENADYTLLWVFFDYLPDVAAG